MIIFSWILAMVVWFGFIITDTSKEFNLLYGLLMAIWYALIAIHQEIKKKKGEIK
jgi:hypothetical protein